MAGGRVNEEDEYAATELAKPTFELEWARSESSASPTEAAAFSPAAAPSEVPSPELSRAAEQPSGSPARSAPRRAAPLPASDFGLYAALAVVAVSIVALFIALVVWVVSA